MKDTPHHHCKDEQIIECLEHLNKTHVRRHLGSISSSSVKAEEASLFKSGNEDDLCIYTMRVTVMIPEK